MKIKICGLKSLDDISYVNEAGADFAGFIFAENSKRKVDITLAKEMKKLLKPNIKSTGVFVNQNVEFIKKISDENIIDLIQLHGQEDNGFILNIKNITHKEVIKAFKPDNNLYLNIKSTTADYILIDSYSGKQLGGTGMTFDWNLIPKTDKKIFLAGGLCIDNIDEAINKVNPYCVDINSGVEINGKKNKTKIIEIVERIRKNYE